MAGVTAQALILLLVLSPGFLALVSFNLFPSLAKLDSQRSILVDTAIFVVISSFLHVCVGYPSLLFVDGASQCDLVRSLWFIFAKSLGNLTSPTPKAACDPHTILLFGAFYYLFLCFWALILGRFAAKIIAHYPDLFISFYGSYFQVSQESRKNIVMATIMTNIEVDGLIVMYEGKLHEISLSSNRAINYVCLMGVERFFISVKGGDLDANSSKRSKIDPDEDHPFRLLIPGDKINNIGTRTLQAEGIPLAADGPDQDFNSLELGLLKLIKVLKRMWHWALAPAKAAE